MVQSTVQDPGFAILCCGRNSAKPGLWTVNWTVDWILDSIIV